MRDYGSRFYDANREKLSERVKEDTRRLTPGQVLRIPAKESKELRAGGGENKAAQVTGEKE